MEREQKEKHKKKKWIILLLLLLLITIIGCGLYFYFHKQSPPPTPDLDEQAVEWEGKQELDNAGKGSGGTISIPCFESLVFKENQTTQKINLYNPESNQCYFVITLIVEQDTLFKSEMIAPDTGFYEIELSKELTAGEYSGTIIYECYSMTDLSPMNGGSFHFDLTVQ